MTRASKVPGGDLLKAAYRSSQPKPWSGFKPSARSLADITIDVDKDASLDIVALGQSRLRRDGVVVLCNLLRPEDVEQASADARETKRRTLELINPVQPDGETEDTIWQVGTSRFKSFQQLATAPKPVLHFRNPGEGYDGGMFEVYNFDQLAQLWGLQGVQKLIADERLTMADRIVSGLHNWNRGLYNLYQNDAVTMPRGLHIDCLVSSYKMLVYLSDCTKLSNGPYCFVPGSHRRDLLLKAGFVNVANGGTNTDFPELTDVSIPIVGRAGTVIISAQFGVHGGQPQDEQGTRSVLVKNYTTLN